MTETLRGSSFQFFSWILRPFFRAWWASLTGAATVLAFLGVPPEGTMVTRLQFALIALALSTLLFLTIAAVYQGYILFLDRTRSPIVRSALKGTQDSTDLVFLIAGISARNGTLFVIHRLLAGAELPFCVLRVEGLTSAGIVQAVPMWTAPGHLRDWKQRKFEVKDLSISFALTLELMRETIRAVG